MNSAAQDTVKEAASTVDTKIIPVMRQAITTVQMILFQHLKKSIFQRYTDFSEKEKIRLAGSVVNNLYGSDAVDSQVNLFARNHRELVEKELRDLSKHVAELIPHITDSLRMQTLCDNQEGIHSMPCLLLAKELDLLDEERELPMPSTFMQSVRKLGAETGLVKHIQSSQPLPEQEKTAAKKE
ncbi:MAG: hypothetical protein D3920_04895 [Candidatus Electrothrix sp. AW2]|jgi:hypothetical protein|nr:hypothetical protein [Candidatus Electrothrix sp. AX1]MCI5116749.1 hypothetical protein [Candidatus Electrothrix gigas]MCI5134408.1 hypothetical protein [Candidatus Electrothrix gigas]MCI5178174.1 hypothetical protein [Candidatus Electrothrix gigas]